MQKQWRVFFGGGYGRKRAAAEAGEELRLDREFRWNGWVWKVPAVYRCREGLAADFVMEVPEPEFRAFMERWGFDESGECRRTLSRAEERQIEQENPLSFDFRAELTLNGAPLRSVGGCGTGWVPGEEGSNPEALAWINHYGLDRTKVMRFWRQTFRWATDSRKSCQKRLRRLELALEAERAEVPVGTFRTPAEGASVTLTVPGQGDYQLTVREAAAETVPIPPEDGWEFPDQVCRMSYTLTPDASERFFRLYDCAEGDRPRRKPHPRRPVSPERAALAEKYGLEAPGNGADSAIAVIGGADGPTAVFWTVRQPEGEEKRVHTVCSSSHFAPVLPKDVTWQAVWCRKPCEDQTVSLICES